MNSKIQLIQSYLNYLLKSKNRHHLQGPFMYQLNDAVFRKDKNELAFDKIESLRKELYNDVTLISIKDFGAGFNGKIYTEKSISYISKRSSKQPKYARLLYRLVNYLKPATMVELGTSVGISALYQAAGNPDGKLYTFEGCENTAKIAQQNFNQFPQLQITSLVGMFDDILPSFLSTQNIIDYVFLDGNHRYAPTLKYFEMLLPFMHNESVVVIDDIHWSTEMNLAWKKIIEHSQVTISIDLMMLGIVFFNPGLSKEHFVIRY